MIFWITFAWYLIAQNEKKIHHIQHFTNRFLFFFIGFGTSLVTKAGVGFDG